MAKQFTEINEYVPPTEGGIKNAIRNGVEEKYAKLGFDIFEGSCGTLVRRLYFAYEGEKSRKTVPSAEACARHAVSLGMCKIIKPEKLPEYVPEFLRKYMWVDTPENYRKIEKYFDYRKPSKT